MNLIRGPRGDSFGRRNMATAIATLEAKFLCRPNTSVGTSALGSFFQDNVGPNQPSGRKTGHFFLRKMILMGKILHKDDQRVNVILDQTIPTEEAVNVRSSSRRLPEATNPGMPSESDRGDSREGHITEDPFPRPREIEKGVESRETAVRAHVSSKDLK